MIYCCIGINILGYLAYMHVKHELWLQKCRYSNFTESIQFYLHKNICFRASYVSVLTVVAFSTERYLAICHPLHKFALSKAQRCLKVIMILWIISFICALPFAFDSDVHYLTYPVSSDHIIKVSFNLYTNWRIYWQGISNIFQPNTTTK